MINIRQPIDPVELKKELPNSIRNLFMVSANRLLLHKNDVKIDGSLLSFYVTFTFDDKKGINFKFMLSTPYEDWKSNKKLEDTVSKVVKDIVNTTLIFKPSDIGRGVLRGKGGDDVYVAGITSDDFIVDDEDLVYVIDAIKKVLGYLKVKNFKKDGKVKKPGFMGIEGVIDNVRHKGE